MRKRRFAEVHLVLFQEKDELVSLPTRRLLKFCFQRLFDGLSHLLCAYRRMSRAPSRWHRGWTVGSPTTNRTSSAPNSCARALAASTAACPRSTPSTLPPG